MRGMMGGNASAAGDEGHQVPPGTAMGGAGRMVKTDRSYYMSILRPKVTELTNEINKLAEEEQRIANSGSTVSQLSQKHKAVAEETAKLKQQLADINFAVEKSATGDPDALLPPDHPILLRAARSGSIARVVYWRHACTPADVVRVQRFYHSLLTTIRNAYGHWYKGIHADTLAAMQAVLDALEAEAPHTVCLTYARQTMAMGVVVFAE